MKKIVSAVALTALAGSLFAADLTVKSEIKYQPTVARWDLGKDGNRTGYATQGTTNDATSIQLKSDGITVFGKLDIKKGSVDLNNAYATLSWGAANITAGLFDSRFTNRVTTDQNDLSLIEQNITIKGWRFAKAPTDKGTGKYAGTNVGFTEYTIPGAKKLGINTNLGLVSKVGQDADDVTAIKGTKADAFVFDYTIADPLPGKLLLKAVAKKNANAWKSQDLKNLDEDLGGTADDDVKSETTNNSAYSFEAAFTHALGTADFVVNLDQDNQGSFGAYLRATAVENLNAVLGFTYAWDKSGTGSTTNPRYDNTYWAIDARARYAITDALAAGVYANLTSYTEKKDDVLQNDGLMALDVVANVNFKINDLAKVFVEGEYATKALSAQKAKVEAGKKNLGNVGAKYGDASVVAQAGVILTPAKGATITTAVRGIFTGVGAGKEDGVKYSDYSGTTIVIPVSFKCSL